MEKLSDKIIKFILDNQNSEYPIKSCIDFNTSEKAIFLNRHNELLSINIIFYKEQSNLNYEDINEKILFKISNN